MRRPDEESVADAVDRLHNDSWRTVNKPQLSTEQVEHLLLLWAPVFTPKVRLPSVPKEYRKPDTKPKIPSRPKVDKPSEQRGRRLVGRRSGGLCEIQVDGVCTGKATDWCHRRGKGQGGTWSPQNGLHGCHECHMWTHDHPATARTYGWMCKSYDPIDTGVLVRGQWVVLDEDGGLTRCPLPHPDQADDNEDRGVA